MPLEATAVNDSTPDTGRSSSLNFASFSTESFANRYPMNTSDQHLPQITMANAGGSCGPNGCGGDAQGGSSSCGSGGCGEGCGGGGCGGGKGGGCGDGGSGGCSSCGGGGCKSCGGGGGQDGDDNGGGIAALIKKIAQGLKSN